MKQPPSLRHIITIVSYGIMEINTPPFEESRGRQNSGRSELELDMQMRHPGLDIPLCESGNRLSSSQKECKNKEENEKPAQRSVIETSTVEDELDICTSRRRNGGVYERAPSELLIAESSNSPRLATLHYSHFIQQLLLPPPITNTRTQTHV